jgi:predicted esterase
MMQIQKLGRRLGMRRDIAAGSMPRPIVIEPTKEHTSTIIFLHGLGDTGNGWSQLGLEFQEELKSVKFVFPTAPQEGNVAV